MKTVFVESEAEADLAAARDWYDAQRPGLGDEFIDEFMRTVGRIADMPESYRKTYMEARQASINRFPYYVFYLVDEDMVSIVAVIHQHRDPQVWESRLG
jgi:plasmid stabilization system protein ParE